MKTYTIDATNKKLGRIATEAAKVLMGKDSVDFAKNKIPSIKVEILNAAQIDASLDKKKTVTFLEYSGYPGGQKKVTMEALINKRGMDAVFRKAIRGMLPANKLRAKMLANLVIKD